MRKCFGIYGGNLLKLHRSKVIISLFNTACNMVNMFHIKTKECSCKYHKVVKYPIIYFIETNIIKHVNTINSTDNALLFVLVNY